MIYKSLEKLALRLWHLRKTKNAIETRESELRDSIAYGLAQRNIGEYDGKRVNIHLTYDKEVNAKRAAELVPLENLLKANLIHIKSVAAFECYLKEKGINAKPDNYLAEKSYPRITIKKK